MTMSNEETWMRLEGWPVKIRKGGTRQWTAFRCEKVEPEIGKVLLSEEWNEVGRENKVWVRIGDYEVVPINVPQD